MIRQFSTKIKPIQNIKRGDKLLISCKNPKFNIYSNEVHQDKNLVESVKIASNGWLHRKSKGDFFVIHPTVEHPSDHFRMVNSINNLTGQIDLKLIQNLINEFEIQNLTDLQKDAIMAIRNENHILLAAETGCGKTLAYLIPIIQNLLDKKEVNKNRKLNTPVLLILTPGRELASQISYVLSKLVKNTELKIKTVLGGNTKQKMTNPEFEEIDILVGTIGAVSKLVTTGIYRMNHVRHVILDEADTLLDDSFSEKLIHFLKKFPLHRNGSNDSPNENTLGTQLVLVSATMPTNIKAVFSQIIDTATLNEIISPNLHRMLPHIQQTFLRVNKSDRPSHLISLVKSELNKNRPIVIFSNKSKTSDFISIFLNEGGVNCLNLNGDMLMKIRHGRFEQFQEGKVNVLSTTDMASRGLDTRRARHVINFDFPLHISDYVHRCGRIGRVGSEANCYLTNFISSRREIDPVQKIELAVRTGGYFKNVNANITGIIHEEILKELKQHESMYQ